jgi:signal transduction histidine kinase
LFRIVQEGLTNIERHAQAQNVSITLHGSEKHVRLTVATTASVSTSPRSNVVTPASACAISVNASNISMVGST